MLKKGITSSQLGALASKNFSPNQSIMFAHGGNLGNQQPAIKSNLAASKQNLGMGTFLTGVNSSSNIAGPASNRPRESAFKARPELPMQLDDHPSKLPTLESLHNKPPQANQSRRKESLNKSISSQKLKNSVAGDKSQGAASKSQIRLRKLKSERVQRERGPSAALPEVNKKKLDLNGVLLDSIRKTRDIRVDILLTSNAKKTKSDRKSRGRRTRGCRRRTTKTGANTNASTSRSR